MNLLTVSGIAQPDGFRKMLESFEGNIIDSLEFGDHHDYSKNDVNKILGKFVKYCCLTILRKFLKYQLLVELAAQTFFKQMQKKQYYMILDIVMDFA